MRDHLYKNSYLEKIATVFNILTPLLQTEVYQDS